jgi:ribosomal protein L37AE/L43A
MKQVLGFFVYQPEKSCPLCGSSHVHRTKRGRVLEFWILLLLPMRPYRCGKCRQRFYAPKKFPAVGDLETVSESATEKVGVRRSLTPPSSNF